MLLQDMARGPSRARSPSVGMVASNYSAIQDNSMWHAWVNALRLTALVHSFSAAAEQMFSHSTYMVQEWLLMNDWNYQTIGYIEWLEIANDWNNQMIEIIKWLKISNDWKYQMIENIEWLKISNDWILESLEISNDCKYSNDWK